MKRKRLRFTSSRSLKPGEQIPTGKPCRTLGTSGYMWLFWTIAPYTAVRCYEHRAVMGNPVGQVHHKNGDKLDNRPENLEVLTPQEHNRRHACYDIEAAAEWYRSGLSYRDISARVGVRSEVVMKSLKRVGVVSRSMSEAVKMSWEAKRR